MRSDHSARNASMGSTRVARRAGNQQASSATRRAKQWQRQARENRGDRRRRANCLTRGSLRSRRASPTRSQARRASHLVPGPNGKHLAAQRRARANPKLAGALRHAQGHHPVESDARKDEVRAPRTPRATSWLGVAPPGFRDVFFHRRDRSDRLIGINLLHLALDRRRQCTGRIAGCAPARAELFS